MKYRSFFGKILAAVLTASFLIAGDTALITPVYADPVTDEVELSSVAEGDGEALLDNAATLEDTAEEEDKASNIAGTITGFDMPEETRMHFEYKFYLGSLLTEFPQTVTVYHDGSEDVIDVSWKCEGDYDKDLGEYTFVPDLTEYSVSEECIIPRIIVTFDEEEVPSVAGYVEDDIDYEIPSVETTAEYGEDMSTADSLPASYNKFDDKTTLPKGLPEIRNQNPYGTCWAFSTIGSLEADLIHDKKITSPDLSELHLVYYMFHQYDDPKGCRKDYTQPTNNDPKIWLNKGGDFRYGVHLLSNLVGAVNETSVPYSEATTFAPDASYIMSKNKVRIKSAYQIKNTDSDEIKKAIMEHGGVSASYWEYDDDDPNEPECYSSTYNSYNYNREKEKQKTNHAVMFVGWDDNFPKENFAEGCHPQNNGAWLVRNSWGDNHYSHFGYFWLSYEDKGFIKGGKPAVAMDAVTDTYKHCYAYDGMATGLSWYDVKSGTVLCDTYDVTGKEVIKAVGFEILSANVTAVVTAKNLSTGASTSSTVKAKYAGFYTAEFEKPLYVPEDAQIEVSIAYTSADGSEVAVSCEPDSGGTSGNIIFNVSKDRGFYEYSGGKKIVYSDDPRMKLYTDDRIPVTGVKLDHTTLTVKADDTATLKATVLPETASDKTLTWSSSNKNIATVSANGKVNGVSAGTATITATTNDGKKTAQCTVTVKPISIKDAKVTLSKNSFAYNGKTQRPVIKKIGNKTVKETDYTLKWSSKDSKNVGQYKVTITGKGRFTGTTKASYSIKKVANTITVKGKTAKVNYSKLKDKAQTLKVSDILTIKKARGKLTYRKVKGNAKIKINKNTGKVTVGKGLKKKNYTVKVKVKAEGNKNYKAATKTVKVTIKVK